MSSKENADYLLQQAQAHGITDPRQLANFMGQMQVECGGFSHMDENLSYSGSRLLAVFPGRNGMNTEAEASRIAAGGPEAIANQIYGGAWGKTNLGNTEPGDGWRFHGRGYVQLTGRANYEAMGRELGLDLVNHPELAADREVAARIALRYWDDRVVPHGHQTDVRGATIDINGGTTGLADRQAAATSWQHKLDQGYTPGQPEPTGRSQSSGAPANATPESTRHLQQLLNQQGIRDASGHALTVDGDYGARTRAAVETFQRQQHLHVDGIAGPQTMSRLEALSHQQHPAHPAHPAPQQPGHPATPAPTGTTRMDQPGHPDHAIYEQALAAVHKLDAQHHRAPDQNSANLAAALTAAARNEGMTRIDRVTLSEDGSRAFAVSGDMNSPLKQVAGVQTAQAVHTSIAQSTQALPQGAPAQPGAHAPNQQHEAQAPVRASP